MIALTVVIHIVNTLAYDARLVGVRTRRLAVAFSLFNILLLFSRFASLFQVPLLAKIVEETIHSAAMSPTPEAVTAGLITQLRVVVLAATVGTLVGAFFLQGSETLGIRAVGLFQDFGSAIRVLIEGLHPRRVRTALRTLFVRDGFNIYRPAPLGGVSPAIFLINVMTVAIYTAGIVSALYAGMLVPEFRSTASMLSGVINGLAAVALTAVIDPAVAMVTDAAAKGERSSRDLHHATHWLVLSRIAGTIVAQILLLPAAYIIAWVAVRI